MDKVDGFLEVGVNDKNEIVINHPDLPRDERGVAHIVFSVNQAQHLSHLLASKASEAAANIRRVEEERRRKEAEAIPVDRSARTLADGSPVTDDHRELKDNGQPSTLPTTPPESSHGMKRQALQQRRCQIHPFAYLRIPRNFVTESINHDQTAIPPLANPDRNGCTRGC